MTRCQPALSFEHLDVDSLVQLARRNDSEAFNELMRRHQGAVRRTAYSILKNFEDAEDAAQETYLRVFKKLDSFEGASKFSTWLTRIAINTSLMRLRQQRLRSAFSLEELTDGDSSSFVPLMDPGLGPEEHTRVLELRTRLNDAMLTLPTHLREIAEDQIYAELSIKDLADRRGITVAAAKSRVYRARKLLSEVLRSSSFPPRIPRLGAISPEPSRCLPVSPKTDRSCMESAH
jgi:RNA polymerase sigma-70 factor (ECF subfamily)